VLQDGTALPRRTLARAFAPTIINAETISAIYPNNLRSGNKARLIGLFSQKTLSSDHCENHFRNVH
jgi:hypothetical protein